MALFGGSDFYPSMFEGPEHQQQRDFQKSQQAVPSGRRGTSTDTSGYQMYTPQQPRMHSSNYEAWKAFLKTNYDMAPYDYQKESPEEKYNIYAKSEGIATTPGEIPTGESGMPDRPPANPMEAALFQWQAGEVARQENQQLLDRAVAAYQYALGTLRHGGPGSLYQATQPIHGQLAQTLSGSEYTEPDFSFWLTPQAHGG